MKALYWGTGWGAWRRQTRRSNCTFRERLQFSYQLNQMLSLLNSGLGLLQNSVYGGRLASVTVRRDPIIIVGHWRSGTTLLHELLCLHPEVTFPNNYCCFAPYHCLLSEGLWGGCFDHVAPAARPMDDVGLVWDAPQEDEFATCALGADSVYWRFGFPERALTPFQEYDYRDSNGSWGNAFDHFMRLMSYRSTARMVLKSPTHSFRLPALARRFPDARFICLWREAAETAHSFHRMLREMTSFAGFRGTVVPRISSLSNGVRELWDAVRLGSKGLPGTVLGIRFHDLLRAPIQVVTRLTELLGLEMSAEYRLRLDRYVSLNEVHPREQAGCDFESDGTVDSRGELSTERWLEFVDGA